jgi:hypothetical protein
MISAVGIWAAQPQLTSGFLLRRLRRLALRERLTAFGNRQNII